MAEAGEKGPVECGFCLRRDGDLQNPKVLPCSHIYCFECLQRYQTLYGVVQCPVLTCREIYDVEVETLPSADIQGDNSILCSICVKKGTNENAVVFCTSCSKSICYKHQQMHTEFHEDHEIVTINEYKKYQFKLEKRTCSVHKGDLYSIGCTVCFTASCIQCLSDGNTCTDGSTHKPRPLGELVCELVKEINDMKVEVMDKEDKLSSLFKQTSSIISDYDTETEKLIETLHKIRDEQLEAIKLKYDKLERELKELRERNRCEMEKFLEGEVGVKMLDLNRKRMKLEARLRNSHQVDIVTGYRDTKNEVQALISEEIPELGLTDIAGLEVCDEKRDVEVVIKTSTGSITIDKGLKVSTVPESITLVKSVELPGLIHSVCQYKGVTYIGMQNNTMAKMEKDYQLTESFLTFNDCPSGVVVYGDRIYTLVYRSPYKVHVHDLTGQLLSTWGYTDSTHPFNKLVIVKNKVIIPDRQSKRLCVYSLTGEVIKTISCPLISNNVVSISAVGDDAVIVSDYGTSRVFKVNISTGEVVWTSTHVTQPESVVCYRNRYVFVAKQSTQTVISILDINTGELLSEVSDPTIREKSHIFDLHISGDTLIVPRYSRELLYYKLC